jgi:hypothetical protein
MTGLPQDRGARQRKNGRLGRHPSPAGAGSTATIARIKVQTQSMSGPTSRVLSSHPTPTVIRSTGSTSVCFSGFMGTSRPFHRRHVRLEQPSIDLDTRAAPTGSKTRSTLHQEHEPAEPLSASKPC